MMSIWNCAHNVGGALVGPMAVYGALWFGSWFYGADASRYFLIGTYVFPAAVAILVALVAYCLIRDTPQSCGLPTIEKYRNDYPKNYSEKQEEVLTAKEIFFKHVFNNKMLWYIAIANAFVYMVRYGCLDWAPTFLKEAQGYDIKQAGWAYFAYEFAAIPGTLVCGWLSDKVFKGGRAMTTIIFMAIVALFIFLYWQFSDNYIVVTLSLIAIGFFIYGPVMLIGVQALDLSSQECRRYGCRTYRVLRVLLRNRHSCQRRSRLRSRNGRLGLDVHTADNGLRPIHCFHIIHIQRRKSCKKVTIQYYKIRK